MTSRTMLRGTATTTRGTIVRARTTRLVRVVEVSREDISELVSDALIAEIIHATLRRDDDVD